MNIQGNLPKTYSLTSWLRQQSTYLGIQLGTAASTSTLVNRCVASRPANCFIDCPSTPLIRQFFEWCRSISVHWQLASPYKWWLFENIEKCHLEKYEWAFLSKQFEKRGLLSKYFEKIPLAPPPAARSGRRRARRRGYFFKIFGK